MAIYQLVDGVSAEQLALARAGDVNAVSALIAVLRPRVFRYCLARLGDRDLADDVTQEVMTTMVTALSRYRDEGRPFTAFVFGIAANKISEARRAARRRPEDAFASVPDSADVAVGPEQAVLRLDATRRMLALLGELPDRQAEVVRLRIAVGFSVEETASVLGLTANAVRVTQHRALARLRQLLVEPA